jgi:hypothetical protein
MLRGSIDGAACECMGFRIASRIVPHGLHLMDVAASRCPSPVLRERRSPPADARGGVLRMRDACFASRERTSVDRDAQANTGWQTSVTSGQVVDSLSRCLCIIALTRSRS